MEMDRVHHQCEALCSSSKKAKRGQHFASKEREPWIQPDCLAYILLARSMLCQPAALLSPGHQPDRPCLKLHEGKTPLLTAATADTSMRQLTIDTWGVGVTAGTIRHADIALAACSFQPCSSCSPLLSHTHSLSAPACGLCVLSLHAQSPVVPETAVVSAACR